MRDTKNRRSRSRILGTTPSANTWLGEWGERVHLLVRQHQMSCWLEQETANIHGNAEISWKLSSGVNIDQAE